MIRDEQPGFFDPPPRRRAKAVPTEQEEQLARVAGHIAEAVLAFCKDRLAGDHHTFFADELRDYVAAHAGTAPASPDRVLRDLRRRGRVRYVVTDRARSLYRIDGIGGSA